MMADLHAVELAIAASGRWVSWEAFHLLEDVCVFEATGLVAVLVHVLEAEVLN